MFKGASSESEAPPGAREQLLTLGHTDLVTLENAVFPPREGQDKARAGEWGREGWELFK